MCFLIEGCYLDRSALGPAISDGSVDGSVPDSAVADASSDADAGEVDAGPLEDAGSIDSGMMEDGGPDSGMPDSGPPDSGPLDSGTFNSCRDETENCIRFQNLTGSPETADWMVDVIWTLMGGSVDESGYMPATCIGGIRREDILTTECRFALPARPATAIGLALVYMYPRYADMRTPCTSSSCPNYPSGYAVWRDTLPQTVMSERRTTPDGSIMVLRLAL